MLLVFSHIQFPSNPIVTQKRHFQQTSNKGHFCTIAPYTVVGGILVGWGQFIHPTSCHPKPRPNTPHNSGVMIKLLSKKIKLDQNHFVILSKKWKYFKHLKSMFQILDLYTGLCSDVSEKKCNMIFWQWAGGQRPFGTFQKIHLYWYRHITSWLKFIFRIRTKPLPKIIPPVSDQES